MGLLLVDGELLLHHLREVEEPCLSVAEDLSPRGVEQHNVVEEVPLPSRQEVVVRLEKVAGLTRYQREETRVLEEGVPVEEELQAAQLDVEVHLPVVVVVLEEALNRTREDKIHMDLPHLRLWNNTSTVQLATLP
jgi:hypothetical protein